MIQADLFNKQTQQEQTCTLTEPDAKTLTYLSGVLDLHYRVTELKPVLQVLKQLMPHCVFTGKQRSTNEKKLLKLMNGTKSMPKKDLLFTISFFFGTTENFTHYLSMLPKATLRVWELVMNHYYASATCLKKETGMDCIQHSRWYSYEYNLPEQLSLFKVQEHTPTQTQYLYLPNDLYVWFSSCFLPAPKAASTLETLPTDKPYLCFNGEREMANLALTLELQFKQAALGLDASEKLKWSTARKLNKSIHAQEFFPKASDNTATTLRSLLLFDSFGLCRHYSKTAFSWEQSFSTFISSFLQTTPHLIHAFLPHLSGIHQRFQYDTGFLYQANLLWNIMVTLADEQRWQDADQFVIRVRHEQASEYNNIFFHHGYGLKEMTLSQAKQPKRTILLEEYYTQMGIPFVKGFLFWMAAWGLIEIAYEEFDPQSISYYDTLRYFRFTELGRYALGKTKSYQFPDNESKTQFEIAEDRLLIRSIHADNPLLPILTTIVESISGNRYKMTSASFLKSCGSLKDIDKQIKFFRQYITAKPPKIWEDFFEQMRQQATAWKPLPTYNYQLYQLPKGDPQLIRILSSDPLLRQYIKRAEDYILIVDASHLDEVKKRLKEYGYLV